MANSFYGGREGAPFILKKSYDSIENMISDFKKGLAFNEVRIGEYVIINTENKKDLDNGKLFRRNFLGGLEDSGAEFIGTIVGPSGPAPHLSLGTPPENDSMETVFSTLVPELVNGQENDKIICTSYSVRTPNAEDTTVYMDFQIPYPVFDLNFNQVSPYENIDAAIRDDDEKNPFYQKWQINIPKGIKGDSISKIYVENDNLFYETCNYDNNEDGEKNEPILIGDYNIVETFEVNDQKEVDIKLSNGNEFNIPLKTPNKLSINSNGNFLVKYNTGEEEILEIEKINFTNSIYLGADANEADKLSIGGLWLETEEV